MKVDELRGGDSTILTVAFTTDGPAPTVKRGTEVTFVRLGDEPALSAAGATHRISGVRPPDRNCLERLTTSRIPYLAWVMSTPSGGLILEVKVFKKRVVLDSLDIAVDDQVLQALRHRHQVGNTAQDAVRWLAEVCLLPGEDAMSPARLVVVPPKEDSLDSFRILGRRVALGVERASTHYALRQVAPGGGAPPSGAWLVVANVNFVDGTRCRAYSAETRATLETVVSQRGSYLEIWRTYAQLEKESNERRAERIGTTNYSQRNEVERGLWRFQLPEADYERLCEALDAEGASVALEVSGSASRDHRRGTARQRPFGGDVVQRDHATRSISLRSRDDDDVSAVPPERGALVLSTFGDDMKQGRREAAELAIRTGNCPMPELGLLLEGHAVTPPRQSRHAARGTGSARTQYDRLTDAQRRAVDIALNTPDIALVQGPPGTGKTQFISALQARLVQLAEEGERPPRILVSSAQHDAVEHLAERSLVFGLPATRLGGRARKGSTSSGVSPVDRFREARIEALSAHVGALEIPSLLRTARQEVISLLKVKLPAGETAALLRRLLAEVDTALSPEVLARLLSRVRELERPAAMDLDLEARETRLAAARGLSTTEVGFRDGGPRRALMALRRLDGELDPAERALLERCSQWEPPFDSDLAALLADVALVRERLLDLLTSRGAAASPSPELDMESRRIACEVLEELRERSRNTAVTESWVLGHWLDTLENDPDEIERAVQHYAAVVAATLQQSASQGTSEALGLAQGNLPRFETVIIDEAARCHPLDLFIPMAMAERRIIFVGDQRQLPHMLEPDIERSMTDEAERGDLVTETLEAIRRSMFARLWERAGAQTESDGIARRVTLDTQFRMHPILGDFVSRVFYERHGDKSIRSGRPADELVHTLSDYQRGTGDDDSSGNRRTWAVAAFIDIPGGPGVFEQRRQGGQLRRDAEARRIAAEVEAIFRADDRLTIGVIAFYRDQVHAIFECLEHRRLAARDPHGAWTVSEGMERRLSVGTVDAFQGKEFDVVLLSVTRSNTHPESAPRRRYGHLLLENRLCVAMSRQKKLLITVGDLDFVRGAPSDALNHFVTLCEGPHGLLR